MKLCLLFLLVAQLLFVASCSYFDNPLEVDMKPRQEPMYNFTQSSALLSCVGEKIDETGNDYIDVYISTIPDHTTPPIVSGFLTKDAVMMVTTALGRLNSEKVAIVGKNGGIKGRRQVQILGAFTELNRTVQSDAISGETIIPGGIELGIGKDGNVNHIALDLAMSEYNRIIPRTPTSVSVHIMGSSGDGTITYDDGGDFAIVGSFGYSKQEGFHSASRLLIETSVAIMMANFYELDIRDCLKKNKKYDAPVQKTPYDKPVFDAKGWVDNSKQFRRNKISRKSHFIPRRERNLRSSYSAEDSGSNVKSNINITSTSGKDDIFGLSDKNKVKEILAKAGLPLGGNLMEGRVGNQGSIYSWKVDGVVGQLYTSEQIDKEKFSFMVNKYLKDYVSNCSDGGVTSSRKDISFEQNRIVFYELGCSGVDGKVVSDGVMFIEDGPNLNILSHRSYGNEMAWKLNRGVLKVLQNEVVNK